MCLQGTQEDNGPTNSPERRVCAPDGRERFRYDLNGPSMSSVPDCLVEKLLRPLDRSHPTRNPLLGHDYRGCSGQNRGADTKSGG